MLWPLCCRGCESGYNYSACRWVRKQRFHYSVLSIVVGQTTGNVSPIKRDPTSYEHYNRMSALTTSVITRLQCIYVCRLFLCVWGDVIKFVESRLRFGPHVYDTLYGTEYNVITCVCPPLRPSVMLLFLLWCWQRWSTQAVYSYIHRFYLQKHSHASDCNGDHSTRINMHVPCMLHER